MGVCTEGASPVRTGVLFILHRPIRKGVVGMPATILKGTIVSAPSLGKLDITEKGYLIAEEGRIKGVFPVLPEQYAGAPVEDYGDALILQSLADLHLHAPQYPMLGMGMDLPLLDWLNAYTFPTDVQFCRPDAESVPDHPDWPVWEKLCKLGPQVREDFLTRNNLQSFSVQDFLGRLDESGGHVVLKYYPYFLKDGDTRIYNQLLLRQPARPGEGGLWAVEQWLDERGTQYLYFPDSGKPAAEHYADLQAACDAGEHPELLTPVGAAEAFVKDYFGHETAEGSFERVPEVDQGYMERNQRLQQLVLDLEFRPEDVDDMDLLNCVGEATADNWGVLGRFMYGSDWFNPLMDAVAKAAVGENQQDRDRAVMSFFLATRDARADFQTPLSGILATQAEADSPAFEAALSEFPEEDQAYILPFSGMVSTSVRLPS